MTDPVDPPVVFRDLPASAFPVTLELIAEDDGELLHHVVIDGPGAVLIPGFGSRPVGLRVTYGDGRVVRSNSRGEVLDD